MDNRSRITFLVLLLVGGAIAAGVLLLTGDDEEADPAATTTTAAEDGDAIECEEAEKPPRKDVSFDAPEQVLEKGEPASATVVTNCGEFTIELDTKRAPKTANSFAFLAQEGFYDDTYFHRIAPGFVIQGGDPLGTGTGGPGYFVDEPPPQGLVYRRGVVAMAKSPAEPPGRSGSQFFVVTAPADAGLTPDYALLGKVSEGMDIAAGIGELGNPNTEKPKEIVVVESVTIDSGG